MISIRRCKILFKTTITYKTIRTNNFMVFIPILHKNNITHCYSTVKACVINLRIKNSRNLSGNNDTSSIKDFYNTLMSLNESFDKKQVQLNLLLSIINNLENKDYNISEALSVMLLSCCGNMLHDEPLIVRLELIHRIWNFLNRKEYPLTLDHYHALLTVYIHNDYAIDPEKFLKDMTITPKHKTYCLLLQVPSTNNCAFADTVTSKLEQNILPIDKTICNALAYAYAINGNADGVTKILNLMEKENLNVTPEIKTYLMYSYARNGQIIALTNSLETATLSVQHTAKIIKYLSLSGNGLHIPNILKHIQPLTTEEDIISTIMQLMRARCISDALTIVTSVPIDEKCENIRKTLALCFLKSVVKLNINQNIMLQVITNLKKVNIDMDILQEAIKFILRDNNLDLAIQLLYQAKTVTALQSHYFWPILLYVKNQAHGCDIYTVIKHMIELNVKLDATTFTDYVLPYIDLSNPIDTIRKITVIGGTSAYIVEPIVQVLLNKGRLKESIEVCVWYKKRIDCQPILDSLYSNYRESNDISTCAYFLYKLTYNGCGFAASFIKKMIKESNFKTNDTQSLISFLNASKQNKVVISTIDAKSISNAISIMCFDELTKTSILNLISDITAISYEENYNTGRFIHPQYMNIDQLNEHYELLSREKKNSRGVLRKLLIAACHQNNVKLVQKLIVQMKEKNYNWTFGMMCNVLDFYVKNKMIEEAWVTLREIQSQFPHKKIDNFKILRIAILLVTENKANDALNFINNYIFVNQKPDPSAQIRELVSLLMQNKHLKYAENMTYTLNRRGYFKDKSQKYRYIILTQIFRGNIEKAVNLFEYCVTDLKKTPAKQEILVELMKCSSDSASKYDLIQKVYNLIVDVHDKDTANINLVIAYALCNRISELRHLLKRNNINEDLVLQQFQYMKDSDIITATLAILEASDSSQMVYLNSICIAALTACNRENDYIRAMELQKKMISKNIQPSKPFQQAFTKLLETHKTSIRSDAIVDEVESNNRSRKDC